MTGFDPRHTTAGDPSGITRQIGGEELGAGAGTAPVRVAARRVVRANVTEWSIADVK